MKLHFRFDNIGKIALIQFFSSLYFYLPILTIYYQQRNLDFVQINSLVGIITGTIFLAEIPTGAIADKIGRKRSIVIALTLQLFGELFFLFAQNYVHFIFISIIAGLGFAFQSGCTQALVYDSLKEENKENEMKQAAGTIGAFFQSGHIIGAFLSSFIIVQLTQPRIVLAILLTVISVGIALFLSLLLKEPKLEYKHSEESPLKIIKESIKLINTNSSLKRIILLGVLTTPFIGYLRNFHPPYFQLFNIPTMWLGLSLTIGGFLAILSSKYAYKFERALGVKTGMFLATITPGIIYLLMFFILHPILAVGFFILNFGLVNIQEPLFADYYNIHIKSEIRATALSTINMISSLYIALMGLVIGWIANYSLLYAFLFMGALIISGAVLFRINDTHVKLTNDTAK
ncbi:MAG: MFS transporter [bacterium]|nr:MFS transporter [bacterium]